MTGIQMLKCLGILLAAFLLVDLYAYCVGQTLSQWIIEQKNKFTWFRLVVFAVILLAATLLIVHFELLK
jgi:hypothetical protein